MISLQKRFATSLSGIVDYASLRLSILNTPDIPVTRQQVLNIKRIQSRRQGPLNLKESDKHPLIFDTTPILKDANFLSVQDILSKSGQLYSIVEIKQRA